MSIQPGFRSISTDYEGSARRWEDLWSSTDAFLREFGGWATPWLDQSWRDGNPIFSAWSRQLRRGFRVIQHDDPQQFVVWRNAFAGKDSPDRVDELVVSCALTDATVTRVAEILREWLTVNGLVDAGPHPRGPLRVDLTTVANRAA